MHHVIVFPLQLKVSVVSHASWHSLFSIVFMNLSQGLSPGSNTESFSSGSDQSLTPV